MQTNSVSRDVIAHHEAGHAVAGLVLGVPFTEVRIVPGEDGKIGVPLKTNPWTGPRPASNPGEFADEEWAELSRSDEGWEAWKKRDNDGYAIFCLAGKAAQLEYAGEASEEDAKADYSFIAHRISDWQWRIGELEQAAPALVREYWPAVQAIAAELRDRSVLSAAEAEEIFKRATTKSL
jgi:hypothetical protein